MLKETKMLLADITADLQAAIPDDDTLSQEIVRFGARVHEAFFSDRSSVLRLRVDGLRMVTLQAAIQRFKENIDCVSQIPLYLAGLKNTLSEPDRDFLDLIAEKSAPLNTTIAMGIPLSGMMAISFMAPDSDIEFDKRFHYCQANDAMEAAFSLTFARQVSRQPNWPALEIARRYPGLFSPDAMKFNVEADPAMCGTALAFDKMQRVLFKFGLISAGLTPDHAEERLQAERPEKFTSTYGPGTAEPH